MKGGGGPLRRLQKSCQTALGVLLRLNVPGGTVADLERERPLSARDGVKICEYMDVMLSLPCKGAARRYCAAQGVNDIHRFVSKSCRYVFLPTLMRLIS